MLRRLIAVPEQVCVFQHAADVAMLCADTRKATCFVGIGLDSVESSRVDQPEGEARLAVAAICCAPGKLDCLDYVSLDTGAALQSSGVVEHPLSVFVLSRSSVELQCLCRVAPLSCFASL
jgi:hypothetical protein